MIEHALSKERRNQFALVAVEMAQSSSTTAISNYVSLNSKAWVYLSLDAHL
jgi:hypothetical protein